MCVVSMVMDQAIKQWPEPITTPNLTWAPPAYDGPTRAQFEELLKLLRAAKRFDEVTGQPDCELESKKDLIRKMAERLGVDVKDL